jgi:hypothetical protein
MHRKNSGCAHELDVTYRHGKKDYEKGLVVLLIRKTGDRLISEERADGSRIA